MFELMLGATFGDDTARGRARVPADHPFLADHFPGVPVLPGSLQLELGAQLAGPLAEQAVAARHGVERWALLGMVRHAAFHAVAALPATLVITAALRRVEASTVTAAIVVTRADDDQLLCRAELVMIMREAEPAWAGAIALARARVAAWKARG